MTNDKKFYDGEKWQRMRNSIMRRDRYMCQLCKNDHVMTQAAHVHHILPREQFPEYEFAPWNLISLCQQHHNEMHNRLRGELSKRGEYLMRATAAAQGIKLTAMKEKILVIGLQGCGKSTYVKKHLGHDAIAYDLDAIASAFRLRSPHEEYFKPARMMANDFLYGFVSKAQEYTNRVYIIRTAPRTDELEHIAPDRLIVCTHKYIYRTIDNPQEAQKKIDDAIEYCKAHSIPVEIKQ